MNPLPFANPRIKFLLPSTLTALIILSGFLYASTFKFILKGDASPLRRHFNDHIFLSQQKGMDFRAVRRGARDLLDGKLRYVISNNNRANFNYTPQSLMLIVPFSFLSEHDGNLSQILASVGIFFFAFIVVATHFGAQSLGNYLFCFLIFLGLSRPGMISLATGNTGLLGSSLILVGAAAFLKKKLWVATFFFALASCVKPVYLPFALIPLVLPGRKWLLAGYAGTHIFALMLVSFIGRSVTLPYEYLVNLRRFVALQPWWGEDNVSLLSFLSCIAEAMGRADWSRQFMTLPASLLVFGFFALGAVWLAKSKWDASSVDGRWLIWILIYAAYFSSLWQSVTNEYCTLFLLLLLPIADHFYELSESSIERGLWFAHSVALAAVFAPLEVGAFGLDNWRCAYLLMGLVIFLVLIRFSKTLRSVIPLLKLQTEGLLCLCRQVTWGATRVR